MQFLIVVEEGGLSLIDLALKAFLGLGAVYFHTMGWHFDRQRVFDTTGLALCYAVI